MISLNCAPLLLVLLSVIKPPYYEDVKVINDDLRSIAQSCGLQNVVAAALERADSTKEQLTPWTLTSSEHAVARIATSLCVLERHKQCVHTRPREERGALMRPLVLLTPRP